MYNNNNDFNINIKDIYEELNVNTYLTTWFKRTCDRLELKEEIDYVIKYPFEDAKFYRATVFINDETKRLIYKLYKKEHLLNNIKENNVINKPVNTFEDKIEESRLKLKNKELTKDNKELLEELERMNDFMDKYKDSFNIQPKQIKTRKVFERDEYITPVLTMSDWHIGSIIQPSYVNGINKYNLEIATNRITYATEKFINHYKNMQNYEIDKIVVCCLGDLIQGELHGTTIEFGVPRQVIEAYNILSYQLKLIKEAFQDKEIEIYFVSGNHSYHRTNEHRYGKNFDVFYNSYESIIAHNLINEGYTVYTSEYNELVANINGLRLLIIHGNEHKVNINNKNSIYNNLDKKKKQFMDFNNDYFDVCLQGHLHQAYYSDTLIIADAPVGLDSYASKNLNINNGKGPGVTTFCITDTGEISNYKVIRVGHI